MLTELLQLRDERPQILGYTDWPDYDAEVKMIKQGSAIPEFIERITGAAAELEAPSVDSTDKAYYAEVIGRENFEVDAQVVREFFDFAKVRAGLLAVTGRLFGLEYVPVPDAPAWHEDVASYDVLAGGSVLGRIYLDLHPREGKFKHFPRGLMEHGDVVTLFHEFGHLVHHVLAGRHAWARFSGVATEWDFVEAPSQMLEEWAWDADILRSFATNAAGDPIPAQLVAKMRSANEFGKGYYARRQMFYAALSYQLHKHLPEDVTATVREL